MLARRTLLARASPPHLLAGCQDRGSQTCAARSRSGAIRVDTAPLAAKGQGATAAQIKPMLERELASLRTAGRRVAARPLHVTVTVASS
jgi:hypothetical protein